MLVVIAIIAILAAMLLPALSRAKEKSRQTRCLANLHQQAILLISFADDNDTELPAGNATLHPGFGHGSTYWVGGPEAFGLAQLVTEGYLSDDGARIFYCPSWVHPFNQYDVVDTAGADPWFSVNQMGGWPAPGNAGPTTHRGIAYQYRSSFGLGFDEPANLRIDDPSGTAISADYWCVREVRYGVTYGHGSNGKWDIL